MRRGPSRARVAVHEAGHAVMAVLAGHRVEHVYIYSTPVVGYVGMCRHTEPGAPDDVLCLRITAAGVAAETIRHKTSTMACLLSSGRGDLDRHEETVATLGVGDISMSLEVIPAVRRTLRRHWKAVEAVAARLMADGVVQGRDVHALVNGAKAVA